MQSRFIGAFLAAALFFLALPFAYLYEAVGPKFFWPLLLALGSVVVVFFRARAAKKNASEPVLSRAVAVVDSAAVAQRVAKRAELMREAQDIRELRWRAGHRRRNIHYLPRQDDEGEYVVINWPLQLEEIWLAWDDNDWDFVRTWLQKYAYALVAKNAPESEHAAFKALIVRFTNVDPLFDQIMTSVRPAIAASSGVLQSDLTKRLQGTFKADEIRYTLYFAAEAGLITRVKKGRSYQLFLAQPAPENNP